MPDAAPALPQRSRFWLFAPFVLLGLGAAGWTTAWQMIRDQTSRALEDWMAGEVVQGRQWACPGRAVGGFPFRIEVSCASLALSASDGPIAVEGTWRLLEASIRTTPDSLQRASVAANNAAFRLTGLTDSDLILSAQRLETHLRPDPARTAEGAYDWSMSAANFSVPGLDLLIGGAEPADLDLDLTVTQGRDVAARPLKDELERWRRAGGRLEIARLVLAKGPRRIEGKGEFGLDDAHRPQGRAELAAAGVEGFLGTVLGARTAAAAALLGALRGKPAEPAPAQPGEARRGANPGLTPLPPLRIEGGRVQLGPLPIPGIRVPPLY
jgi:hypothetical protein